VTVNAAIAAADLANLIYTPTAGYTGPDAFTWTAAAADLIYATPSARVDIKVGLVANFQFNLSPLGDARSGQAGQVVTYSLSISNAGNVPDSYHISLETGSAWGASLSTADVQNLIPGAQATLTIKVTIPANATGSDTASIRVASLGNAALFSNALLKTTAAAKQASLPVLISVSPTSGSNQQNIALTLHGTDLVGISQVFLGNLSLGSVTRINDQVVTALIPAGAAAGSYDVRLCNSNQACSTLVAAFILTDAAPVVSQVSPAQGFSDSVGLVRLVGANFTASTQVSLGTTLLAAPVLIDPMNLQVVIPAGLTSGSYAIKVCNGTNCNTVNNAYQVLDPNLIDLSITSDDVWTNPISIHAGNTIQLGANIHRQGGTGAVQVKTAFFQGQTRLGATDPVSPPMLPGAVEAVSITWTPPTGLLGQVLITIQVDPDNAIAENNKLNNTVTVPITILPQEVDVIPPVVTSFKINNGNQTTGAPAVSLSIAATDNPGGSGVGAMYIAERIYNPAARLWQVIQSSGWLPFKTSATFQLTQRSGIHYLQVWVADKQGNISENPIQAEINYVLPQDTIAGGETRIYRQQLQAGQTYTVTLNTLSGDTDLYVWDPDGNQVGYSIKAGAVQDSVTFMASVSGTYQIEVYGYPDEPTSTYLLTLPGAGDAPQAHRSDGGPATSKTPNTQPAVATSSVPLANTHVTPAPVTQSGIMIFLPILTKQ
jgi:hypothetical protein